MINRPGSVITDVIPLVKSQSLMTRTFCCQIQLNRLAFMTEDDVLDICDLAADKWDDKIEIQTGGDNRKYVNVILESDSPAKTWGRLKWTFIKSKMPGHEFANAVIVTVTGNSGWDDYLLLHHYDSYQKTVTLPEDAR